MGRRHVMRRLIGSIAAASALGLLVGASVASSGTSASNSAKAGPSIPSNFHIKLRWGIGNPNNQGQIGQADVRYAQLVQKLTNNKVTFDMGFNSVYGATNQVLSLVGAGTLDMADVPASSYPQQLPTWSILNSPSFLMSSAASGAAVVSTLMAKSPLLQQEWQSQGAQFLMTNFLEPYWLEGKASSCNFNSLKGNSVRSFGSYVPLAFQSIGMNPVNVAPTEWYTSLDRGVVNWMLLPIDSFTSANLQEVAKTLCTASPGGIAGPQTVMSLKTWKKLPKAVQQIMVSAGTQVEKQDAKTAGTTELLALQTLKDAGGHAVYLPRQQQFQWAKTAPNPWVQWQKTMNGMGKSTQAKQLLLTVNRFRSNFFPDQTLIHRIFG